MIETRYTYILAEAREKMKYTQEEIAEIMELSSRTISNWENGKTEVDVDSLKKLAKLYRDPTLPLRYLVLISGYREFFPRIIIEGIGDSVQELRASFNEYEEVQKRLEIILRDKKIDDTEKQEWEDIESKGWAMAGALISLIIQCKGQQ